MVKHKVISKPGEKNKVEMVTSTVKRTALFPPLQDVLEFDMTAPWFAKKLRRTGPAFVIMRVLQQFRETEGRDPSAAHRTDDVQRLCAIRDELAAGLATPIDDSVFVHVFEQISPAAAIVGGELAQEIIKAVSQKEAPHNNVFLFDPDTCTGFVESIASA